MEVLCLIAETICEQGVASHQIQVGAWWIARFGNEAFG